MQEHPDGHVAYADIDIVVLGVLAKLVLLPAASLAIGLQSPLPARYVAVTSVSNPNILETPRTHAQPTMIIV
jgi:hypothetical protein